MEEQVMAPRACVLPAVGRRVHASLAPEALHCGEMTASYRDSMASLQPSATSLS